MARERTKVRSRRTRGDADNAACAKWQKRKPVLSPAGE